MININKYKYKKFNKNMFIDKRIKALFLFYDQKVNDSNLSFEDSIRLLNHMIETLAQYEEYELAAAFKKRKFLKYKKNRKKLRIFSFKLIFRYFKYRINKFLKF